MSDHGCAGDHQRRAATVAGSHRACRAGARLFSITSRVCNVLAAWRRNCVPQITIMTAPGQSGDGAPRQDMCVDLCHEQQNQQRHPQAGLVLHVVTGSNPSSPSSSSVLRPFQMVCSEGHAAALRTIRHLHLDRCVGRGVPYERQLCVLAAADQATALTISSSQIEGLVACLLQAQQQQQQEEEEEQQEPQQVEGVQQGVQEMVLNRRTSPSTPADISPAPSTRKTNSSSSTAAAVASHPTMPAAKPRGPYFSQLTVVGPVSAAGSTFLRLEQLLDLLPGTQHLQQVVLTESMEALDHAVPPSLQEALSRNTPILFMAPGTARGPRQQLAPTRDANGTTPTATSGSSSNSMDGSSSSSSSSSSWRSSCQIVAAILPDSSVLDLANLQPLLAPLQQLRALYVTSMCIIGLPTYVTSLRGLQALHIVETSMRRSHIYNTGVLARTAELTNLRHLGISGWDGVAPLTTWTWPDAFSCLVHLTSLDLSCRELTGAALEGVCSVMGLHYLDLSGTSGFTTLPPSISKLVSLQVLWLWEADMGSLPECLTALTALRLLAWSEWAATGPLPLEVVWRLRSLRDLYLQDDHLTALPDAISELTGLHQLHLRGGAMTALPTSMSALVDLQSLHLEAPQLRAVPVGITALTRLQEVKARGVRLQDQSPAVQAFLAARQAQGCVLELAPADSDSVLCIPDHAHTLPGCGCVRWLMPLN